MKDIKKNIKKIDLDKESENDTFSNLSAGDIVLACGILFTARDKAHKFLAGIKDDKGISKAGKDYEFLDEIRGSVIYHCGPLVKKTGSTYRVISAGPTTSARMNKFIPDIIGNFNIRAIIGKGGVDERSRQAMRGRCVYLILTGGCGALAAGCMEVIDVYLTGFGMPEAVWKIKVREMPLMVGIDIKGNSLFDR